MPTPEEIKKIAREIARLFVHPDDHSPYREQVYRQVEAVITQLSKDYAIVPKEQIYMRHGVALALMEQDPSHKGFYRGQSSVLESIFGKELFNEEKE